MTSHKVEDYLKAIYELEEAEGLAKTTLLAEKLGIQAGTVSEMIKRLSKGSPRLITYKHHHGVRLTLKGKKTALGVIRRHRLLETFLHQTLGLSWDEVHKEAEVLEHHLSERVTDSIDRHLDFPKFDPHGEPIPDKEGNIVSPAQINLSDIHERQIFKIIAVNPVSSELLLYLESLGIGIHSSGSVISKSPLDGPIKIRINQKGVFREHTLGRNVTDQIYVERI
ncbi:MAG: metal-dependent transcriptional regulator [Desulfobacterales bacterium]|jgi:DtxR family Mn-dependent transcriptional regulator